jgi:hypothetical protein
MKAILITLIVLSLWVTPVIADPFLHADPQIGVKAYSLTGPAWITRIVPAEVDGSLKLDLGVSAIGITSGTIKSCDDVACVCTSGLCGQERVFTLYKTYSTGRTGGVTKTPTLRFEWWVIEGGLKIIP